LTLTVIFKGFIAVLPVSSRAGVGCGTHEISINNQT